MKILTLSANDIHTLAANVNAFKETIRKRAKKIPKGYGNTPTERTAKINAMARTQALYTLLANHDLAAIEKIEDDRSASEFANDLFSSDNHPDMHPSTLSRQRNALEKRVEEVGLFTVELIVNGESISAIGGFVGDDFYGSGYDDDFYREAIELLSDEYKNFIESAQAVLDVI